MMTIKRFKEMTICNEKVYALLGNIESKQNGNPITMLP